MTTQYDRAYCEARFKELDEGLGDAGFMIVWQWCAFMIPVPGCEMTSWEPPVARFFKTWRSMSLWNRQEVLFLMIPRLECIVHNKAMEMAARARKEEPL
jgi:hypothetical protein